MLIFNHYFNRSVRQIWFVLGLATLTTVLITFITYNVILMTFRLILASPDHLFLQMRRMGSPLIPLAHPLARTHAALKGVENATRGRSMQTVQVQVAVVVLSSARGRARTRPASCRPTEPSLSLERTLQIWSFDSVLPHPHPPHP